MENTENNNPPVIISIRHHYGKAKWRMKIIEYLNSSMRHFTRSIKYYESDKGAIDKALKLADKYSTGEHIVGGGTPRPVQIDVPDEFSDQQMKKVDETYLEELEPLTREEDE